MKFSNQLIVVVILGCLVIVPVKAEGEGEDSAEATEPPPAEAPTEEPKGEDPVTEPPEQPAQEPTEEPVAAEGQADQAPTEAPAAEDQPQEASPTEAPPAPEESHELPQETQEVPQEQPPTTVKSPAEDEEQVQTTEAGKDSSEDTSEEGQTPGVEDHGETSPPDESEESSEETTVVPVEEDVRSTGIPAREEVESSQKVEDAVLTTVQPQPEIATSEEVRKPEEGHTSRVEGTSPPDGSEESTEARTVVSQKEEVRSTEIPEKEEVRSTSKADDIVTTTRQPETTTSEEIVTTTPKLTIPFTPYDRSKHQQSAVTIKIPGATMDDETYKKLRRAIIRALNRRARRRRRRTTTVPPTTEQTTTTVAEETTKATHPDSAAAPEVKTTDGKSEDATTRAVMGQSTNGQAPRDEVMTTGAPGVPGEGHEGQTPTVEAQSKEPEAVITMAAPVEIQTTQHQEPAVPAVEEATSAVQMPGESPTEKPARETPYQEGPTEAPAEPAEAPTTVEIPTEAKPAAEIPTVETPREPPSHQAETPETPGEAITEVPAEASAPVEQPTESPAEKPTGESQSGESPTDPPSEEGAGESRGEPTAKAPEEPQKEASTGEPPDGENPDAGDAGEESRRYRRDNGEKESEGTEDDDEGPYSEDDVEFIYDPESGSFVVVVKNKEGGGPDEYLPAEDLQEALEESMPELTKELGLAEPPVIEAGAPKTLRVEDEEAVPKQKSVWDTHFALLITIIVLFAICVIGTIICCICVRCRDKREDGKALVEMEEGKKQRPLATGSPIPDEEIIRDEAPLMQERANPALSPNASGHHISKYDDENGWVVPLEELVGLENDTPTVENTRL